MWMGCALTPFFLTGSDTALSASHWCHQLYGTVLLCLTGRGLMVSLEPGIIWHSHIKGVVWHLWAIRNYITFTQFQPPGCLPLLHRHLPIPAGFCVPWYRTGSWDAASARKHNGTVAGGRLPYLKGINRLARCWSAAEEPRPERSHPVAALSSAAAAGARSPAGPQLCMSGVFLPQGCDPTELPTLTCRKTKFITGSLLGHRGPCLI